MNLTTWQRQFKNQILNKKSEQKGMEIYLYAIYARLYDSLSDDFSMVKKELGEIRFKKLILDFLAKHPSKYPSLTQMGEKFPSYVKRVGYFKSLYDLATLEWKMCVMARQEDGAQVQCRPISELTQEDLLSARLVLNSNLIYEKSLKTLIYKNQGKAYFEKLTPLSKQFYDLISKGGSLNKVIAMAAKKKIPAKKITEIFSHWTKETIIIGFAV